MRVRLTDAAIRSKEPGAKQYTVGDAACPGLYVRITPNGVKAFVCAFRNKATGKVEGFTIGRYPDVTLTRAREVANDARKTVANGGTPVRPADAEKNATTYAKVVEQYHAKRLVEFRTRHKTLRTL